MRLASETVIVPCVIPLFLLLIAAAASAAVAWGSDPRVADRAGGVAFLCTMHRLEWIMIALAVAGCMAVVGLVVFGKRRAWWLIGLLPVVAMFGWRFSLAGERMLWIEDQPTFASIAQTTWLTDDDPLIALSIEDQAYAYPLAAMQRAPLILQSERARKLLIAWSAGANCATAAWCDRSLRGRDLEIVAAPRGVLLVYNRRLGEFFETLSLRTTSRAPPTGVQGALRIEKTTWSKWKAKNADGLVLQSRWVPTPLETTWENHQSQTVALISSDPPVAVSDEAITLEPENLGTDRISILVFEDDVAHSICAFDRRVDQDLFPKFDRQFDKKRKRFVLIDSETQSQWNTDGVAVEGPLKGKHLMPLLVQRWVDRAALAYWRPDVKVLK